MFFYARVIRNRRIYVSFFQYRGFFYHCENFSLKQNIIRICALWRSKFLIYAAYYQYFTFHSSIRYFNEARNDCRLE